MASVQIDNLTDSLQRYLGLQQAQTFYPEDTAADAIARLLGRRGNVERLLSLWNPGAAQSCFEGWSEAEHRPVLIALRRVLDASLVVQRYQGGAPKSFLPLTPELITNKEVNTVFRDLGRSVVDGLWQRGAEDGLSGEIEDRMKSWDSRHPLAVALGPLCSPQKYIDRGMETSHLSESIKSDPQLTKWVRSVVTQDWRAWLTSSRDLSVDEQIETMAGLIGQHLHVALLWRLRDLERPELAPGYFASIAGHNVDAACTRAAYNCYAFWGDRAGDALKHVAAAAIEAAARADPELDEARSAANWTRPGAWLLVSIKGKSKKATQAFHHALHAALEHGRASDAPPTPGQIQKILIDALVGAFSGASGVVSKVKDYLRTNGSVVGLVGPEAPYARKRYLVDERALSLFARLHAARRPEDIRSNEDEKRSIEALLDDLFERYGMIVTREREVVREYLARYSHSQALRPLLKHLPGDEPMRKNRALFDRRLDELRLVRRYSDASAVIHVP